MAGKKIPSVEDQVKIFKDVITRTSGKPITDIKFVHVNKTALFSITIKNKTYGLFMNIDQGLWIKLLDDPEINMTELDISNPDNSLVSSKISMVTNIDPNKWIAVNGTELFNGMIIKIRPDQYDYDISLNKNLLPVKLKKSEYTDIGYTVFENGVSFIVAFKKEFKFQIEDCGFSLIRLFQVM